MPGGGASRCPSATCLKSTSTTSSPVVSVCGLMSRPLRSLGPAALAAGGGAAGVLASAHPAVAVNIAASAVAATVPRSLLPILGFIPPEHSYGLVRKHLSDC